MRGHGCMSHLCPVGSQSRLVDGFSSCSPTEERRRSSSHLFIDAFSRVEKCAAASSAAARWESRASQGVHVGGGSFEGRTGASRTCPSCPGTFDLRLHQLVCSSTPRHPAWAQLHHLSPPPPTVVLTRPCGCIAAGQEVFDVTGPPDFLFPLAWLLFALSLLCPPGSVALRSGSAHVHGGAGARALSHPRSPGPFPSQPSQGGGQLEADGAYGHDTLYLPEHASGAGLVSLRGSAPGDLPFAPDAPTAICMGAFASVQRDLCVKRLLSWSWSAGAAGRRREPGGTGPLTRTWRRRPPQSRDVRGSRPKRSQAPARTSFWEQPPPPRPGPLPGHKSADQQLKGSCDREQGQGSDESRGGRNSTPTACSWPLEASCCFGRVHRVPCLPPLSPVIPEPVATGAPPPPPGRTET